MGLFPFQQMSSTIFSVGALPKGRFSVAQHHSPLLLLKVAAHLHLVQRSTCRRNSIPRTKLLSYNEITFRRDYKNDLAALSQLLLSNPVIVGFGMYLDISASLSLSMFPHTSSHSNKPCFTDACSADYSGFQAIRHSIYSWPRGLPPYSI
jgi:hypothetical protein